MDNKDNIIDFSTAAKELKELDALDKIGNELEALFDRRNMGKDPSKEDFEKILSFVPDDLPEISEMIKGVRDHITSDDDL